MTREEGSVQWADAAWTLRGACKCFRYMWQAYLSRSQELIPKVLAASAGALGSKYRKADSFGSLEWTGYSWTEPANSRRGIHLKTDIEDQIRTLDLRGQRRKSADTCYRSP